jgi:3-deoxy-D-manno-octulosonic acid kinase
MSGDIRVTPTPEGAVLFDGARYEAVPEQWFERQYWHDSDAVVDQALGRGTVLVVRRDDETWVLRHYHRGGLVSRFVHDHYLWLGLERTRAFREWRLLRHLLDMGLPVPRPVAARVVRQGPLYQADIITAYLASARALAEYLRDGDLSEAQWMRIGAVLKRFHDLGVNHPDLTAQNILLDTDGLVYLVDFDKAAIRRPGRWRDAGIARLQRSLRKVALETGTTFAADSWDALRTGYDRGDRGGD